MPTTAKHSNMLNASTVLLGEELLPVVKGLHQFHVYLYGHCVTVCTDHAALKWLLNFHYPEGQVTRWLQQLQDSDSIDLAPILTFHHVAPAWVSLADTVIEWNPKSIHTTLQIHDIVKQMASGATAQNVFHVSVLSLDSVPSIQQGQLEFTGKMSAAQEQDPDIGLLLSWLNHNDRPPWSTVAPCRETFKCYWAQWDRVCSWAVVYSNDCGKVLLVIELSGKLLCLRSSNVKCSANCTAQSLQDTLVCMQDTLVCNQDPALGECANVSTGSSVTRIFTTGSKAVIHVPQQNKKPKASMRQCNVSVPAERIALDILGPLPLSNKGNKYILVISDYFK